MRPVVETGWEVMLINRALQEGRYDAGAILRDYTVREVRGAKPLRSIDRSCAVTDTLVGHMNGTRSISMNYCACLRMLNGLPVVEPAGS